MALTVNYQQILIKWIFRRNFQTLGITLKMTFIVIVKVRESPEAPFYWKLLIIDIVSSKWIRKNVPVLQVGGHAPTPLAPPVFRVVLLHTKRAGKYKDTCPDSVHIFFFVSYI